MFTVLKNMDQHFIYSELCTAWYRIQSLNKGYLQQFISYSCMTEQDLMGSRLKNTFYFRLHFSKLIF